VIIRADLFDAVDRLEGDRGARPILEAHGDRTITVPLADDISQHDVDTPEDLQRFAPGSGS
jgi:molybdenum cofactor cytidylyltransferase